MWDIPLHASIRIMPTAHAVKNMASVVIAHTIIAFNTLSGYFLVIGNKRLTGAVSRNPTDPATYARKYMPVVKTKSDAPANICSARHRSAPQATDDADVKVAVMPI